MADSEIEIERISRKGDTILTVGTPADTKLLVSTEILIDASEVFAALFDPNDLEGQETATKAKPREVKLPEDDGEAMSAMCNLVHGSNINDVIPTSRLLAIAVLTDMYACVDRLKLQWRGLLLDWIERRPSADLLHDANIAAAAIMTQQSRSFKIMTNRLITQTTEQYTNILKTERGKFIPAEILLAMEQKRSAAYQKIATDLLLHGMHFCDDHEDYADYGRGSVNHDDRYIDELCEAFEVTCSPPDFKADEVSVARACEIIRMMGVAHRDAATCECTGGFEEIDQDELQKFSSDVMALCSGLCLPCYKEG